MNPIYLSKPDITKREEQAVLGVLRSGNLAAGSKVKEFEKEFELYVGVKESIAVSSGTTALHTALLACDIGKGDKVITTPYTFIATSNAVLFCEAKPIFCDIDPKTYNLDPNLVEDTIKKNKRVKAILVVHLYGQPCDMDAFLFLSKKYRVKLIEDCAQSIGATYKGRQTGSFGDAGCFSFYATKNLMTGEGGMITTHIMSVAKRCQSLINHGRSDRFFHSQLGYNFRTTDISASLGLVQLSRIDEFTKKRIGNAEFYSKKIETLDWVETPSVSQNCIHAFHQYAVLVPQKIRNKFIEYLHKNHIYAAPTYPVTIPDQPFYKKMGYKRLPISSVVSRRVVCLPVHTKLTRNDLTRIVDVIKRFNP